MEHYEIEVCGVRRQLPYIPIKKDLAFASFVIISDTELISACGKELADRIGPVDALVTAEAKGIALAYEVSRQMGLKEFIVIRKSVKAYMKDVVETTVNSITTTEMQRLYLDGVEADKIRSKNISTWTMSISTGRVHASVETVSPARLAPTWSPCRRPGGRGGGRPEGHHLPEEAAAVPCR